MSTVIETRDLTRTFASVTAVDKLNIAVSRGEVFGLVGPDGAGKTTTLRILCALMNPTSGVAMVAGYDVAKNANAVKARIGYMAQKFGLYGDLTVGENMVFYADLFGITGNGFTELSRKLLAITRMEPFRDRPAAKLSGGMKQKLALICTLLHKPEILFLDEPTNGVDPVSRRDFWLILNQLVKAGTTVFVTTAYLDEAERCDRIGLMHEGRLIKVDTPRRLKEDLNHDCFEVRAADLRSVRDLLLKRAGIASAALAGNVLHVLALPGMFTPQTLQSLIAEDGSDAVSARTILPSLEDVLIATIDRQERGHAKA